MSDFKTPTVLSIEIPAWAAPLVDRAAYPGAPDRMALAVALARENVRTGTGGPFGAAVFDASGRPVAAGMNLVLARANSVLHAEVVAMMLAEERLGTPDLEGRDLELVTSCEPCAMCLGALHWSGIKRLVIGARREDVERIGFAEGPVFEESYAYLEARGLQVTRDVLREEAVRVLEMYAARGGAIY